MLNQFTNPRSWIVASCLAAASIFGQATEISADTTRAKPVESKSCGSPCPAPQPCPPKPACPPKPCCPERPEVKLCPAYNAPARIEVDGCWDLYFGASFIYWQARQGNMAFAANVSTPAGDDFFAINLNQTTTASIVDHDFDYKPGFKVLAGMNFDRDTWDGYAEYTWFSSNTSTSTSVGADTATTYVGVTPVRGNPSLLSSIQTAGNGAAMAFNSGEQEWKLSFQALDTALARTYYVGTQLTFRTIMGARFAWFTQELEQKFVSDGTLDQSLGLVGTYSAKQNFSSWGAGLLAGLNTRWMLGEGFSLVGNGSVDILYTRVQSSNSKFHWSASNATYSFPEDRPDFLMPHMNLEFGFAWGSYFDCYNWHVDFAATYSFQQFWDANIFRDFTDFQGAISQAPNGSLQMHGLNLSARLDF